MSSQETYQGLRARLRARTGTSVAFLDLGSATSAQVTALAGFDAVVVDLEHGAGDEAAARAQIIAAQPHAEVIVRTPDGAPQIARMLDAGAGGVLIPRVGSAAQAAAAAAGARYASGRGVSGLARSTGYGIAASGSWRVDTDRLIACIVQIERRTALEEVKEIAALEDVDALLVGPADLANDLGVEPTLENRILRDAALSVAAAAAEHDKTAGIHLAGADPSAWVRAGFTLISTSFESALLLAAFPAALAPS